MTGVQTCALPISPSQLNPSMSAELEDIIRRALEKDRELRYQHAADMRADLQRLKRDSDSNRFAPVSRVAPTMRRRLWWLAAAAVVIVAAAVAGYFVSRRPAKLTDKDTIVLADFDNKTGDTVFDDTLRQGLSVQLEQSPFLDLISDSKVNRTLKLMGRPAGDRLTPEVTREVCQRTGSKAMLTGSIAACQGRSKTRPLGRSKTRPVQYVEERRLSGRRASGAEACAA